ncbi:MAG: hypothetical protein ACK54H_12390 [Phycisphaerales bacterium]
MNENVMIAALVIAIVVVIVVVFMFIKKSFRSNSCGRNCGCSRSTSDAAGDVLMTGVLLHSLPDSDNDGIPDVIDANDSDSGSSD